MEMQLFPWIRDDIAIEIIGKMIAEQTEQLYKLIADHKKTGLEDDSQELLTDLRYQKTLKAIDTFRREIDQIYNGAPDELYQKIDQVYVPYLKNLESLVG